MRWLLPGNWYFSILSDTWLFIELRHVFLLFILLNYLSSRGKYMKVGIRILWVSYKLVNIYMIFLIALDIILQPHKAQEFRLQKWIAHNKLFGWKKNNFCLKCHQGTFTEVQNTSRITSLLISLDTGFQPLCYGHPVNSVNLGLCWIVYYG